MHEREAAGGGRRRENGWALPLISGSLLVFSGLASACSPAGESAPGAASESGAAGTAATAGTGENDPDVTGFVDENESPFVPVDEENACAVERAETVESKDPVDIIVIVDNSASMGDELAATERNINESFAAILEDSGLDYRVIALTLHRRANRSSGGNQAATMLCVARPLSDLEDCTSAPEPEFSERFFQYSTRIQSADSFDVLLDTYAPPFDFDDREDQFGNAPLGWSEWLRPGVKKVILELSDGNEDMAPDDFLRAMSELDPESFGADPGQPGFIFHSIVDVAEKVDLTAPYLPSEAVEPATCSSSTTNSLATSGEAYQEVSRLTGGLRFPICQSAAYDVVFREIAGRVIAQSNIACDFPVPEAPEGRTLNLDAVSVAIEHEGTGAQTSTLGQARVAADCAEDAFYIENERITLCPDVCSAVRGEEGARVDVLFGCQSTIIVR
jgi:hypothetical protein